MRITRRKLIWSGFIAALLTARAPHAAVMEAANQPVKEKVSGKGKLIALIRTYFALGGMEMQFNIVSGKPMSLFKLPCVANTFSSAPTATFKIEANISLTVVFPLLPVIATTGIENLLRQYADKSPKARRVSFTSTAGLATPRLTNTAPAPRDPGNTAPH